MADCNCNVNVFILAVSINRTLATPTAKAALHLATAWKPFRDSICLYARHQVQSELGGGILVNGHTEYLVAEGKSHWPRDSPVIQVRNLLTSSSLFRDSQGLLKLAAPFGGRADRPPCAAVAGSGSGSRSDSKSTGYLSYPHASAQLAMESSANLGS